MPYGQPMASEQRLQWKGGAIVSYSRTVSGQLEARSGGVGGVIAGCWGVWLLPRVCDACFSVAGHIREEPEKNRRHVCEEQSYRGRGWKIDWLSFIILPLPWESAFVLCKNTISRKY